MQTVVFNKSLKSAQNTANSFHVRIKLTQLHDCVMLNIPV